MSIESLFLLHLFISNTIANAANVITYRWTRTYFYLGIHVANIYLMVYTMQGLPGGSDGKESACSAQTWVQSVGPEDPLEEGMTTHSRILAWSFPWKRSLAGLQSMGSQRVGHD